MSKIKGIYIKGLVSTPYAVGINDASGKMIEEIDVWRPTGEQTRQAAADAQKHLSVKYRKLLGQLKKA